MPEYAVAASAALVIVVALELVWLRTGLFRQASYWVTMAIVLAFQVIVDGWLTKLSAPIVLYARHDITGWRPLWDVPIEDFAYGAAMVTMTLMLWERFRAPGEAAPAPRSTPSRAEEPERDA